MYVCMYVCTLHENDKRHSVNTRVSTRYVNCPLPKTVAYKPWDYTYTWVFRRRINRGCLQMAQKKRLEISCSSAHQNRFYWSLIKASKRHQKQNSIQFKQEGSLLYPVGIILGCICFIFNHDTVPIIRQIEGIQKGIFSVKDGKCRVKLGVSPRGEASPCKTVLSSLPGYYDLESVKKREHPLRFHFCCSKRYIM